MDLSVGGRRLICMASPDGSMKMCTTGEHLEVSPTSRLVYTESMADEQGNVVPMGDTGHPMTTEVTVELENLGGSTKMVLTHAGVPADSPGATGVQTDPLGIAPGRLLAILLVCITILTAAGLPAAWQVPYLGLMRQVARHRRGLAVDPERVAETLRWLDDPSQRGDVPEPRAAELAAWRSELGDRPERATAGPTAGEAPAASDQ